MIRRASRREGRERASRSIDAALALLLVAALVPTTTHAAPDCNPHSIASRAVGGEIVNRLLGGLNDVLGAAAGVDNGISPTPSSAMADCIVPRLNPPPPGRPDENPSPVIPPAGGWGDPHLISHDGLGFDFQGEGDYAYVQSDAVVVQARQVRIHPSRRVSRIAAVAIRAGDTTVVINDPIDPSRIGSAPGLRDLITVDGEDVPIGLGGWIELDDRGSFVMRFDRHTYVSLAGTLRLLIGHGGSKLELVLDDSLRGAVTGVLGDFDGDPSNDLRTAAGATFAVDDTETLYGAFLRGWIREGGASLFNSPFVPFAPDAGNAVAPGDVPTVADAAPSVRAAAAERCAEAGVSFGYVRHGCVYDLVFDENDRWLADAADIAERDLDIVPATALAATGDGRISVGIDARVSSGVPTPGAGALGVAGEVDRYAITLPIGALRVLRPLEPCSDVQTFGLLLDPAGASPVEHPFACGSSVLLPSGESTVSVFSHGGDTGAYAFDLAEPATTDIGVVALDTPIEGSLPVEERLVATLPGGEGDRVFVASRRENDCGRRWELTDGDGNTVRRTSVCVDLGLLAPKGAAPHGVRILPGPGVDFGFVVLSVDADTTTDVDGETRFDLIVSTPGQRASATFPLTAGERIYIDREGGVDSGTLILTGPDSAEVDRTSAFEEDLRIDVERGGDHTLTLEPRGDFTGTVPVTLIRVANDTDVAVRRGESVTLTLSTLGQRASASIDLVAGETLSVTIVSRDVVSGIAATPAIELPGGTERLAIFGSRTITASVDGTYRIVLESSENDDFIGSMTFEVD